MARKLPQMLQWINEQVSHRTSGKNITPAQRAKIFNKISREAKRKKKRGDFD